MKKLLTLLTVLMTTAAIFGQSATSSPGTGHWVAIDSGYQVGTTTDGETVAPLYFYNTSTSENITGMQFKVKYDNTAFTAVVPSLKISTSNQVLDYVDDKTNGYLTVTLVYTGTNSSFNYSNGATFDLTFTHAAEATWNTLDSIKTLKISDVSGWSDLASTNYGNDTTLTVYSYGGRFNQRVLRFVGKFINTTGTDAPNLWVSLEKKPKTGSTWSEVAKDKTDANGKVVFREFLDTTYWDTRMAVKGDTMGVGSIYSTADAQQINKVMLGKHTLTGFDYYTFDVNGNDGAVTIADVYTVYARLSGRFSQWPNSQEDVLFFTETEYNTIDGSSTNQTSTISGVTNFTYYINGDDSVVYYVAAKGDANNTGFKKARLIPIKIVNPANANKYIIDQTVEYDDVIDEIEVNMPQVKVDEGNLINVPVKVFTGQKVLGALQLDLKYDTSVLVLKGVQNTEKIMKWVSYFNPHDGVVSWGGADLTDQNLLTNGETAFTLQFTAKKPQDEWSTAALWTGAKFVGDRNAKDMNIKPTNGVVEVRRIKNPIRINEISDIFVYPNPNQGQVVIEFRIQEETGTEVSVTDLVGREVLEVIENRFPAGEYRYVVNLERLVDGMYIVRVQTDKTLTTNKIIISR